MSLKLNIIGMERTKMNEKLKVGDKVTCNVSIGLNEYEKVRKQIGVVVKVGTSKRYPVIVEYENSNEPTYLYNYDELTKVIELNRNGTNSD